MRSKKNNKILKYIIGGIILLILVIILKRPVTRVYSYAKEKSLKLNDYVINYKSKIYLDIRSYIKKVEYVSNFSKYLEDIEKKDEKYQKLELELGQINELKKDNLELRKLLDLKKEIEFSPVAAKVILRSESDDEYIYISKGKEDDIQKGLVVVYNGKMIGRIDEVYKGYSKVKLLSSKTSKISVIVNKKELAILRGNGNSFSINNYSKDENYFEIETSGISDSIPKGIKIGIFELKNKENFLETKELEFTPRYNYVEMKYVLVLKELKKWERW